MPFLMPDGTRLSSLIDRAEPTRQKKSSKSKQPYKHRLDALYELKGDADASEVAAVSRLGARSRLRCDADHVRCTEVQGGQTRLPRLERCADVSLVVKTQFSQNKLVL
jgi:hypothetical protein